MANPTIDGREIADGTDTDDGTYSTIETVPTGVSAKANVAAAAPVSHHTHRHHHHVQSLAEVIGQENAAKFAEMLTEKGYYDGNPADRGLEKAAQRFLHDQKDAQGRPLYGKTDQHGEVKLDQRIDGDFGHNSTGALQELLGIHKTHKPFNEATRRDFPQQIALIGSEPSPGARAASVDPNDRWTPTGTGLTSGLRDNNPGNIRASGDQWEGMTGKTERGYLTFNTPENGLRALAIDLRNQQDKHNLHTVAEIVSKFSPKSDGNATDEYIQTVAKQMGVKPDQQLDLHDPKTLKSLMAAIIHRENSSVPYTDAQMQGAVNTALGGSTHTLAPPTRHSDYTSLRPSAPLPSGFSSMNEIDRFIAAHAKHDAEGRPVGDNGMPLHLDKLDPEFKKGLAATMADLDARGYKGQYQIIEGFRTREEQVVLYENRRPGGNPVAAPGTSDHERGMAADIKFTGPKSERAAFYRDYHQAAVQNGAKDKSHLASIDAPHMEASHATLEAANARRQEDPAVVMASNVNEARGSNYKSLKTAAVQQPVEIAKNAPRQQDVPKQLRPDRMPIDIA